MRMPNALRGRRRAGRSGRTRAHRASSHRPPRRRTRPLPLARRQRRMRLRHVARQRQHQRDRVLRRRHDVRLRRVRDDDPPLGRRGTSTLSTPIAGAPDHPQPAGALERSASTRVAERISIAVVVADALGELLTRQPSADVDLEALAQQVDAGVGDLARRRGHGRVRSARRAGYRRGDQGQLRRPRERLDPRLLAAGGAPVGLTGAPGELHRRRHRVAAARPALCAASRASRSRPAAVQRAVRAAEQVDPGHQLCAIVRPTRLESMP